MDGKYKRSPIRCGTENASRRTAGTAQCGWHSQKGRQRGFVGNGQSALARAFAPRAWQRGAGKRKNKLNRKQTSENPPAGGTGKARTIQVEVRKKRVFVKSEYSAPVLLDQAQSAASAAASHPVEPRPLPEEQPASPADGSAAGQPRETNTQKAAVLPVQASDLRLREAAEAEARAIRAMIHTPRALMRAAKKPSEPAAADAKGTLHRQTPSVSEKKDLEKSPGATATPES